jgi:TIR domain-containing protein
VNGRGTDFFISHAGRDTAWAEWLAWQLQQAGYTVELAVWDWAPGEDFVARMQQALERADRLLAVCTDAYFASAFGSAELRAAFAQQSAGRIVPVLIEPVTLPPLYAPLIHLDLTGLDEATASARLRARLAGGRPTSAPPFPRAGPAPMDTPRFAGRLPQVWKVPPRNPRFTGRNGMLAELRGRLRSGDGTLVVQALYGLGGVGKTQLAIEYAHRFAADYDPVWWIDAAQPVLIPEQLAILAARLGLPSGPTVADTVERLLAELRVRDRWLLILDNAERPADIADYRPGGAGHVLITSRNPGWGALGGRLEVDVLARTETIALLRARIADLDDELADKLAAELGDLPLAAAQAAGYLEQTDLPAGDYLRRFRAHRADLLARGEVVGYHGRLDTA